MVKWKLITVGLLVLSIILCMMTIYTQREYYFMQMMYTRVEAENIVLKKDYEKLYDAYYSYDKKVLKSLEGNKDVFWAEDSSAYMIVKDSKIFFSFYKKPKMEAPVFLWSDYTVIMQHPDSFDGLYLKHEYRNIGRIDSLKPHQFISAVCDAEETTFIVAPKCTLSSQCEDSPAEDISSIYVKY